MAKIDNQFMPETAEKPYPLGRIYLYSPYKGVPPPPGNTTKSINVEKVCVVFISISA